MRAVLVFSASFWLRGVTQGVSRSLSRMAFFTDGLSFGTSGLIKDHGLYTPSSRGLKSLKRSNCSRQPCLVPNPVMMAEPKPHSPSAAALVSSSSSSSSFSSQQQLVPNQCQCAHHFRSPLRVLHTCISGGHTSDNSNNLMMLL